MGVKDLSGFRGEEVSGSVLVICNADADLLDRSQRLDDLANTEPDDLLQVARQRGRRT